MAYFERDITITVVLDDHDDVDEDMAWDEESQIESQLKDLVESMEPDEINDIPVDTWKVEIR